MSDAALSAPGPSQGSTSQHPHDHLKLRVTYLIAGNPRPPHDLGLVPASTTVAELKARLQQELLEHPQPHEQRLIYQGRPLMQSTATLREALRLEGPVGPLPYTIHIIISSRPASSHFRPSQPVQTSQQDLQNNRQPHQPPPVMAQAMDPQSTLEQAQRVQAMAQAQLAMMQQQMAVLNPALAQTMGHMPPNFNATIQIHGQQMQLPHHPHHHHHYHQPPQPASANLVEQTNTTPGSAGRQREEQTTAASADTQGQRHNANGAASVQQGAHPLGIQADPLAALRHHHGLEPMPRPSSAPGHPPAHITNSAQVAPRHTHAPSMSRTSQVFGPFALPMPPQTHLPFPFGAHMQNQPTSNTQQPTVWLASSRNGPEALLFAPGHGYYTSAPTGPSSMASVLQPSTTTASTNSTTTAVNAAPPTATGQNQQRPNQAQAQPAAGAPPNARAPLVPGQVGRDRQVNPENDDMFAFIIQRGWLFLRLYMFMFVLSEPGTWRRYMLLFLAVVVCLLPRRNPLNNAFAAARRHIDNLIGPPHPQPRDRQRQGQGNRHGNARDGAVARLEGATQRAREHQANATQGGPSTATPVGQPQGASNTTPEETAQRLLREQEQRNPILRGLYRIEQAIALFLASLIPGVGERHVAAREEVRREEERARVEEQARREAEEKKAREEAEGGADGEAVPSSEAAAGPTSEDKGKGKEKDVAEPNQEQMVGADSSAQAGSSSSVEARPEAEDGIRARFT